MLKFVMLALYVAANVLMLQKGRAWLCSFGRIPFYRLVARGMMAIYLLCAALPIVATLPGLGRARNALQIAGNLWLGFFFYLILCVFVMQLWLFARLRRFRKRRQPPHGFSPRVVFRTGFLLVAFCFCISVGGWMHARQLETTEYSIAIAKAAARPTLTIAFAADLHLGSQVGCAQMEKMVKQINAMRADLVLFGGDLFDSDFRAISQPERLREIFRGIQSRYGVYGVYGNHDVQETLVGGFAVSAKKNALRDPEMERLLADCGVEMLEDRVVSLLEGSVYLAGRLDGIKAGDGTGRRQPPSTLLQGLDREKVLLVLEHEPVQLRQLQEQGVDLVLSGHTHGGQLFPLTLFQNLIWENPAGLYRLGEMNSVVTTGVGFYGPPIRVGTRAEVVKITLQFHGKASDPDETSSGSLAFLPIFYGHFTKLRFLILHGGRRVVVVKKKTTKRRTEYEKDRISYACVCADVLAADRLRR